MHLLVGSSASLSLFHCRDRERDPLTDHSALSAPVCGLVTGVPDPKYQEPYLFEYFDNWKHNKTKGHGHLMWSSRTRLISSLWILARCRLIATRATDARSQSATLVQS